MATLADEADKLPDAGDAAEVRRLRQQLEAEKSKRQKLERELTVVERVIEQQNALIERKASQLFRSPKAKQNVKGGHFHRICIPDTHGAHIDKAAAAAFLGDLEYLSPREVVWLGDHIDCGGFLAQHHTIGFVPETAVEFPDDVAAANEFIDEVQKRTPKAEHHFLTGNHEHRIERWCCQQALSKTRTAQYFLDKFGVEAVLHLQKRGFHYYARGQMEPQGRVRGAIKRGRCWFVHDVSTARNAAQVAIGKWGTNVVFGDTHRIDMACGRKAERDIIASTNGCLSIHQPYWQETNVTDWSHGYGVQIVTNDGDFLHIIVPIIDGRSLLGPLLGQVK
jgi:hypothetical protein